MTVIRPNSISGVTSITAQGGDITYFKSDGTRGNQFTHNVSSTGVITATKFVGPIEGNLSGGTINATSGTITGNLGVGGVLTYEDVTNIDSIGIITARAGINVSGGTITGDGSGLTGVGLGTDGSANTSGIITATAFVPTTGQLSHRNIIINGAMLINQRSTSHSTSSGGYHTVDRFKYVHNGNDNNLTQSQADVASGTTPYTLGFRKSYKLTNGNQTGGAGTGDRCRLQVNIEAQDIANSGWNYKSASSFITLSFWVKSSVAQNFYGNIRAVDGTAQNYSFETGSLTADTWTKVIKTIPGNSNLTFDNNVELGWNMDITQFMGTDRTSSGNTMNQWAAYDSSNLQPDNTGTWFTTNGATWEITGMQLEVGPVATPFEHRTVADELARCQRYCVQYNSNNANRDYIMPAKVSDGDDAYTAWQTPVATRTTYPTISVSNTSHLCLAYGDGHTNSPVNFSSRDNTAANPYSSINFLNFDLNSSVLTAGDMVFLAFSNNTSDGYIRFEWEL